MNNRKIRLKILIIGPPKSGKTSFIHNLVSNQFLAYYQPTQSYELTLHTLNNNQTTYQIQLWDCGYQHLNYNRHIRNAFFRNSSAALIIFDLCDPNREQKFRIWLQQAYRFQCYLVYAICTKKDVFEQSIPIEMSRKSTIRQSLLQKHSLTQNDLRSYQQIFKINQLFDDCQIKHFYQCAKDKVAYQIKNIFISIHDDRQKLSRSSLARGIKFDNSIVDQYLTQMQKQFKKQKYRQSQQSDNMQISQMNNQQIQTHQKNNQQK